MEYIPTIGLEIHAELKTKSKMFCPCRNDPDEERPNVNICPICLGHPGTLPVLNHEAIRQVLKVGVALSGRLADFTEWDRKNYFYPDIPKGYQVSQYKYPLVSGGVIAGIDIERIHLEEDTARSTHDTHDDTLVDFNRSGVPLLELVTKPVIHDAASAVRFARELQLLLRYLGVSDANMEKGEMRVEANISIAPDTDAGKPAPLGTKTEVKNLNSFRVVERAITHEISRQTSLLEGGGKVTQETRGWNDVKGETFSQRSKESSHDYRYFPEPDIPKMKLSEIPEFALETLKKSLPELPWDKRKRLQTDFAMTDKEVAVFMDSPDMSKYYEEAVLGVKNDPKRIKLTTNYFLSDYLGTLNASTTTAGSLYAINPKDFAKIISMVNDGKISSRGAKDLIGIMIKLAMKDASYAEKDGNQPGSLAEKHGLIQNSSSADLEPMIAKVIAANTKVVDEYKAGKVASLQFLIGQAMKETRGAANPAVIKDLLIKKLV